MSFMIFQISSSFSLGLVAQHHLYYLKIRYYRSMLPTCHTHTISRQVLTIYIYLCKMHKYVQQINNFDIHIELLPTVSSHMKALSQRLTQLRTTPGLSNCASSFPADQPEPRQSLGKNGLKNEVCQDHQFVLISMI
ncbi:hypothetical protein SS50377_24185 [Spironucleus salmonicida]|nr:hypothetical protein SS50377_24185 [Spironucleus salmonicida]